MASKQRQAFRMCILPRYLTGGDTNILCVACLGEEHARSALEDAGCEHCDVLPLRTGACLVFWGPSAIVPGGAPLGVFCDRFWGRDGYRLHFIDTIPINTVIHTTLYNLVQK